VNVEELDTADADTWNDLVRDSRTATPFHQFDALRVIADRRGATLHPLVGYVGAEPVGLFPVFSMEKAFVTAAFSPPPDLKISYLGPATVNTEGLGPRKRETRRTRFVETALDWVETTLGPRYTSVRTSPEFGDPRPFTWRGYETGTRFTYVVDLDRDAETLFDAFTSDLRTRIRQARDAECVVRDAGVAGVAPIIGQVRARHAEQDVSYHLTPAFVEALVTALPDDVVRVYTCERDGEVLGGNVVLDIAGTVYGWQGVAKTDTDLAVNDLIHWEVITDAMDRGTKAYDLVGANTPRLSRYKAKFSPRLERYYTVERATPVTRAAAEAYKRLR
jgi:hypothetical protein